MLEKYIKEFDFFKKEKKEKTKLTILNKSIIFSSVIILGALIHWNSLGVAESISFASYLMGCFFAIRAALRFKNFSDTPIKLSVPITEGIVAALLLLLPLLLTPAFG